MNLFRTSCIFILAYLLSAGPAFAEDDNSLGERLEAAGARIKEAVANGEMTPEEGWSEWYAARDRLIESAIDSGEITPDAARSMRRDIHKAELSQKLGAAGGRIKEAIAEGTMTEEEGWAEWYQTKERLIDEAVDAGEITDDDAAEYRHEIHKAELSSRLGKAGERLKDAVTNGEISADEARDEWNTEKEQLINDAVDAGEISDDDAADFRHEIRKAELGDRLGKAGERIRDAVTQGEMTTDEGWAEWYAEKNRLIDEAVESGEITTDDAREVHHQMHEAELWHRLTTEGEQIKTAAEGGAMSAEEARAAWDETSARLIDEAISRGEITAHDAAEFRRHLALAEAGERLKQAVESGEMTEQEAWAEWAKLNAEYDARSQDDDDAEEEATADKKSRSDEPWAPYVREFISRHQLNAAQRKQAWRFHREALKEATAVLKRLDKARIDATNPRERAEQQRLRDQAQREHDKHFNRLRDALDALPTAAQRATPVHVD